MADVKAETWPWNLIEATRAENETDPFIYFGDTGNLITAMLAAKLTDRERRVLELRYHECKTLEETAKEFGVTRERVRQVEIKAIRKMRCPAPGYILKYGTMAYVEKRIREEVEKQTAQIRAQLTEQLEKEYSWKLEDMSEKLQALEGFKMETLEMPIEYLDLSVRAYNCLKRSYCNTVGDIVSKFPHAKEAYEIRNLGRKSMEEVRERLAHIGVRWPKEDEA